MGSNNTNQGKERAKRTKLRESPRHRQNSGGACRDNSQTPRVQHGSNTHSESNQELHLTANVDLIQKTKANKFHCFAWACQRTSRPDNLVNYKANQLTDIVKVCRYILYKEMYYIQIAYISVVIFIRFKHKFHEDVCVRISKLAAKHHH